MTKVDPWLIIHTERKALAADLEALTEEQWATPSLCSGWTVRDVVAHMTAAAKTGPPQFFAGLIATGFSFNRLQSKGIAAERGDSPSDALGRFKAEVGSSKHPPGPNDSWLGEAIVHGEDIRRPLGIGHDYPTDAARQVAEFYKGSNLIIGSKRRIAGLKLRATDTEWSHGDGPEAAGPIVSLVMAMTGRKAALDDLSGDGVAALRSRS